MYYVQNEVHGPYISSQLSLERSLQFPSYRENVLLPKLQLTIKQKYFKLITID